MRPPKNRKRRWAVLAAFCAFLAIAAAGLENRLTLRRYTVGSEKVKKTVRIALLTDLHSCFYGEGQRELLDMVEVQHPDVVLLGGDIVDDVLPEDNAWLTVRRLAARYPTYYVTGNHEYRSGRVETIRKEMAESGVIVLAGECRSVFFTGAACRAVRCGRSEVRRVYVERSVVRSGEGGGPGLLCRAPLPPSGAGGGLLGLRL
ncbi:metallophosphoesterase [Intestinimonas butyriciproducens]|uniref:metallophosphoesterase n=1 Tax=Intestinimonas butyriciproducens TaxID=1297617 RepID=UPI004025E112